MTARRTFAELDAWRYEPPYDFYDGDEDPVLNPERYFVARDDDGDVVGFYYFEPNGDVLEYGLGLRPDLTGRGLGLDFFRAGLEFARERYRPPRRPAPRRRVQRARDQGLRARRLPRDRPAHAHVRALGRGRVRRRWTSSGDRRRAGGARGASAVVALETTLVAHGFPPGEGVAVGLEAEARVREAGAVPATIGVLDGRVRVGLERGRARALRRVGAQGRAARSRGGGRAGRRRRDDGRRDARRLPRAGIAVMATGGLGGVHRGWTEHPDVSSDLGELARTRVVVVASGVKSLLDVPATAEVLETLAVPVLGFRTDELPLFYSARAGRRSPPASRAPSEAAAIARAHWELGGGGPARRHPPARASTTSSR